MLTTFEHQFPSPDRLGNFLASEVAEGVPVMFLPLAGHAEKRSNLTIKWSAQGLLKIEGRMDVPLLTRLRDVAYEVCGRPWTQLELTI